MLFFGSVLEHLENAEMPHISSLAPGKEMDVSPIPANSYVKDFNCNIGAFCSNHLFLVVC